MTASDEGAIPDFTRADRVGAAAPKGYVRGTHRTCSPADTLARLHPLFDTFGITRIANVTGLDRTGIPVATACRPNSRSLAVSQGKGLTLEAAKASAVMEAVELWHAERVPNSLKLASTEEMQTEHQVAAVDLLPQARDSRYTAALRILWVQAEDLLAGGAVWVPYELVNADYTVPLPTGSGCFQSNTNGLASGNHRLEAISHALCEVIERDARTLWRIRPRDALSESLLDLDSVDDQDCRQVLEQLRAADLQVRVWDITTDVGVASFVCVVMGAEASDADPEYGSGCHPVRSIALLRALTEAAQARNTYISGARDDYMPDWYRSALRNARNGHFQRLFAPASPQRSYAHVPTFESSSIDGDLRWMLARLRMAGLRQVAVVDLTREAIGIPVVRVIVPGLEGAMGHAADDYAPGLRARRHMERRSS
jgi:YcaO-like protein with predicted kinase domain